MTVLIIITTFFLYELVKFLLSSLLFALLFSFLFHFAKVGDSPARSLPKMAVMKRFGESRM